VIDVFETWSREGLVMRWFCLLLVLLVGCQSDGGVKQKVVVVSRVDQFDFDRFERSRSGCSVTYERSW